MFGRCRALCSLPQREPAQRVAGLGRCGLIPFVLALGAGPTTEPPVRLFAAASLTDVLAAVLTELEEAAPSTRVVVQYGGSSDLARQILAGAPADLFLSADRFQVERVAAAGGVTPESAVDLLGNRLVVVAPRDRPDGVATAADLERLGRIAMADPEAVPAGVYARLYLEQQGLWERLRPKVVPTLDVRAALAAVASGNVDGGFVYRTDAALERRVQIVYSVPPGEGPSIRYVLAIVAGRERSEVRRLYDSLRSPAAGRVFARYGFIPLAGKPQRPFDGFR